MFFLHWFLFQKTVRMQNLFLLIVSYVFYGWWDWRYLFLIAFGSAVTFISGKILELEANQKHQKIILAVSCSVSLGLLCVFKYYNFFVESFINVFNTIGINFQLRTLKIFLPVGISFYTFRMLSYTIDIYKQKIKPAKDVVAFFAFISFFPHLAAGPIERAGNLLPQFYQRRVFDYQKFVDGMRQMLWGFFKKIVIADNCATIVNDIYQNFQTLPASTLLVGAFYFTFQIYCDFSGYSDIAIGCARLFGFESMRNFAYPYFSRDMAEFWRRWHISLTTWFRDYLYIPLGGSRGTTFQTVRNTLIIFLVCGFWHGANWSIVVWGFVNGLYLIPRLIFGANRKHPHVIAEGRLLPNFREAAQMTGTFSLAMFAWIFFRADTIGQAFSYIRHIFSKSLMSMPKDTNIEILAPVILLLIIVEWVQRHELHALDLKHLKISFGARWLIYYALISLIFCFNSDQQTFIYFQF
jgi:alginate O-acetyltransferase complex protein AlgI